MEIIQNYWLEALSIGANYGVNPVIFAGIYIGAIPLFSISIGWLVNRYRNKRSIALPSVIASGFFLSSYVYAILFGKNLPWWFYAIVIAWVLIGALFVWKSTKNKLDIIKN